MLHPNEPPAGFQPRIELLQVTLCELVQRNLPDLRDDVLVNPILITELCIQTKLWLAVVLIPKIQPFTEGHILLTLRHRRGIFFFQFFQFRQALCLGFGKNIFRFGVAAIIVADDNSGFPTSVRTLSDSSAAVFSFLSQGLSLPSHDLVQEISHDARRFFLHLRGHMGVCIQREGRIGVS